MPVTTTWMYDKRVIVQKQIGTVTAKQMTEAIEDLRNMIREGDAPVHVFIDASQQSGQPDIGLGDLKTLVPKVIEGSGWMVVIQPSTLQRFFTSLGMQLAGAKYKFVKDEQEAINFLVEQDPTLNGLG